MLNKKSIKTILNVKHTCIDNVTMLADTSIMIEVHATKGQQCRCGIVILQILPIKKAGFMRPAAIFSIIQLSNSRAKMH